MQISIRTVILLFPLPFFLTFCETRGKVPKIAYPEENPSSEKDQSRSVTLSDVRVLKNSDIEWADGYGGTLPLLSDRARNAIREENKPFLREMLNNEDTYVVAHVLLVFLSENEHPLKIPPPREFFFLPLKVDGNNNLVPDDGAQKLVLAYWAKLP